MIEAVQKTFFVVSRHPRLPVGKHHVLGYFSRFGEINQPSADFGIVVNYQNTATHNLQKSSRFNTRSPTATEFRYSPLDLPREF